MPTKETTKKLYRFRVPCTREASIPMARFGQIYAEAAAALEADPTYGAHHAILKAGERISDQTARMAAVAFFDAFGCWAGNDEGVTMLCFASAVANAGDL